MPPRRHSSSTPPTPRRQRTYRAEYEARIRRAEAAGFTRKIARGHGPVPLRVAKRLEEQKAGGRRVPQKTIRRYRKGIVEYEQVNWGEVSGHRLTMARGGRRYPRRFQSEEEAREYAEEELSQIPTTVIRIKKVGRYWIITIADVTP